MRLTKIGTIAVAAAGVAAVGVSIFWPREPEHAELARCQRARDLHVVEFDLRELDAETYGHYDNRLQIRTKVANGDVLLFRRHGGKLVFAYDTMTGSATPSSAAVWDAAEGEIIDEYHLFPGSERWGFKRSEDSSGILHDGKPLDTRAKNHFGPVISPSRDKIALVTADGRFTPGTTGIFGGSPARVSGQSYVEILSFPDAKRLIEPVAIRSGPIFWSADEHFVICNADLTRYCVVPTGLKQTYPLLSGEAAKAAGYGLYSLEPIGEYIDRADVEARYLDATRETAIVELATVPPSFFAYDLAGRTLKKAESADWKKSIEWPRPRQIDAREREQFNQRVATALRVELQVSVGPGRTRAVLNSKTSMGADCFYQQLCRWPIGEPIGDAVRIPLAVAGDDDCLIMATDTPRPSAWAPDERFVVYLNPNRRVFCIVHTEITE